MLRRSVGPRVRVVALKASGAQGASTGAVVHEIAGWPVRTCLWQMFSQVKMRPRGPSDVSGRPRGPRVDDDLPSLEGVRWNAPPGEPFLAPAPPRSSEHVESGFYEARETHGGKVWADPGLREGRASRCGAEKGGRCISFTLRSSSLSPRSGAMSLIACSKVTPPPCTEQDTDAASSLLLKWTTDRKSVV